MRQNSVVTMQCLSMMQPLWGRLADRPTDRQAGGSAGACDAQALRCLQPHQASKASFLRERLICLIRLSHARKGLISNACQLNTVL